MRKYFDNIIFQLENELPDIKVDMFKKTSFVEKDIESEKDFWDCEACTFVNPISNSVCQICEFNRINNN